MGCGVYSGEVTARLLLALLAAAPSHAEVVSPDAPCVNVGDNTEKIPEFDPLTRTCPRAELGDVASFAKAWDRILAKVKDAKPLPVGDEFQLAVGRGNVRAETLSEAAHWGDIAYIQMKTQGARKIPVAGFLVTTRAVKVRDMLTATRMDFQTDGFGHLRAVHVWHGIKLPGAPGMAWSQGPVSTINQDSMLEGLWSLRFRQLVRSWAE